MNIQSVAIKNFRSYGEGEQAFDVSNYPMVVITGDNGSGKSSIIEAVLFCLFGDTSITKGKGEIKKSELLNDKTKSDAVVSLTFELNGRIYKIERTLRRKTGTSGSARILDCTPEVSSRARQARDATEVTKSIEQLIGMDYDSFTHSVIMTQGEFEALTAAKPADRKKLFVKMFGLLRYDDYQKEAKNRKTQLEKEMENISGQIQMLEADVEKESEIENKLTEAKKHLEKVKIEVNETEENKKKIKQDLTKASDDKKEYDSLVDKQASIQEEIEKREEELKGKRQELQEIVRAENELKELEPKLRKYDELQPQLNELQAKEKENLKLAGDIERFESVMETKRENWQSEIQRLSKEKDESINSMQEGAARVKSLEGEIAGLGDPESETAALEKSKKEIEASRESVLKSSVELETKISSIKETLDTLEKTTEPKCPVCDSDLTEEKKEERIKHLEDEKSPLEVEKQKLDKEIKRLEKELKLITDKIKQNQEAIKSLGKLRTEHQTLQERIKQLQGEIEEKENQLKTKQEGLSSEIFLEEEKKQIEQLKNQTKTLNYDQKLHSKVKGDFDELKEVPQKNAALTEKVSTKSKILNDIGKIEKIIEDKRTSFEMNENRKNELEDAAKKWEELNKQLEEIDVKLSELQSSKGEAKKEVENLIKEITEIKSKKKQLDSKQKEYSEKQILDGRLSILEEAFSKDGIPFRMLKKIVPLVGARSTELLHKLTETKLGLEVNMEQDKIYVKVLEGGNSKHVGRYSGGEKMRINFALRLAISELLTKMGGRAASIESLMIDEGFGALDDDGRQAIINIFNLLRSSFKKIIAITHIKEVQEMFEVQFRVEKVGDFSRIIAP
ncbi:MAG: AAA family ATPase [Candidatus Lokiarchaeia archaeon]